MNKNKLKLNTQHNLIRVKITFKYSFVKNMCIR